METSLAESQTDSYFRIKWPNGYLKQNDVSDTHIQRRTLTKINHDRRTVSEKYLEAKLLTVIGLTTMHAVCRITFMLCPIVLYRRMILQNWVLNINRLIELITKLHRVRVPPGRDEERDLKHFYTRLASLWVPITTEIHKNSVRIIAHNSVEES